MIVVSHILSYKTKNDEIILHSNVFFCNDRNQVNELKNKVHISWDDICDSLNDSIFNNPFEGSWNEEWIVNEIFHHKRKNYRLLCLS